MQRVKNLYSEIKQYRSDANKIISEFNKKELEDSIALFKQPLDEDDESIGTWEDASNFVYEFIKNSTK